MPESTSPNVTTPITTTPMTTTPVTTTPVTTTPITTSCHGIWYPESTGGGQQQECGNFDAGSDSNPNTFAIIGSIYRLGFAQDTDCCTETLGEDWYTGSIEEGQSNAQSCGVTPDIQGSVENASDNIGSKLATFNNQKGLWVSAESDKTCFNGQKAIAREFLIYTKVNGTWTPQSIMANSKQYNCSKDDACNDLPIIDSSHFQLGSNSGGYAVLVCVKKGCPIKSSPILSTTPVTTPATTTPVTTTPITTTPITTTPATTTPVTTTPITTTPVTTTPVTTTPITTTPVTTTPITTTPITTTPITTTPITTTPITTTPITTTPITTTPITTTPITTTPITTTPITTTPRQTEWCCEERIN